jgi:cytochrome c553
MRCHRDQLLRGSGTRISPEWGTVNLTIAGRSPSYLVRQLYDMQRGNRNGAWTPLMASVVAHLGPDDLLTAAAYLASLKP